MTDPVIRQPNTPANERGDEEESLKQIRESLRGLQFGSVNIIVQDGVIIQIDRTEKRRLRVGRAGQ